MGIGHHNRLLLGVVATALLITSAAPARAHSGTELTPQSAWFAWSFTPDILVPTALVAIVFTVGAMRRGTSGATPTRWRQAMFVGGLGAIVVALQSSIDPIAEHVFLMHQVQHLLLMIIGPVLIMASAPEPVPIAGLPHMVRHNLVVPVVSNRLMGSIFACLTHPIAATVLLGGTLYFWMLPVNFNAALGDEAVHYLMHVSMLFTGLLFWWRVLDRRPPPQGTAYLSRAAMLEINLMMVAFLGAYLTSKDRLLYRGHDLADLYGIAPLMDERIGGIILWMPGSAILLAFVCLMLRRWLQQTERRSRTGLE